MHCAKNKLNFRIKTKPVKVYVLVSVPVPEASYMYTDKMVRCLVEKLTLCCSAYTATESTYLLYQIRHMLLPGRKNILLLYILYSNRINTPVVMNQTHVVAWWKYFLAAV